MPKTLPILIISSIGLLGLAAWNFSFFVMILSAWIALSLICVVLSYSLNWAFMFRKKSDGSIPWYMRWIFVPYLSYVHIYNLCKRYFDDAALFQKITDKLYVGARLNPADVPDLKKQNISCILDLTAEFDGLGSFAHENEFEYLNIPILDHSIPKPLQLNKACRWIHKQRLQGKSVLVHCALGRGRSVLIVAAYLMAIEEAASVKEALQKIQAIRSTAKLNKYQERALTKMMQQGANLLKSKAVIIANPVSGGGKWASYKDEVLDYLRPYFSIRVFETTPDKGPREIIQNLNLDEIHTIVACGGDGTVNEVANSIADSEVKMGILPLGTANSVCQVLVGMQSKIMPVNSACSAIIKGETQRIDMATCNDESMLLAIGVGLEQQMIEYASRENKNALGQLAYIHGLIKAVNENKHHTFRIKFDDEDEVEIHTNSLMVANAAPSSSILAQGGGNPLYNDGYLDVTWLENTHDLSDNIKSFAELVSQVINGKTTSDVVKHRRIKAMRIRNDSRINYVIDGENRDADEISIRVRPSCVNVYVDPDEEVDHHALADTLFGKAS